MNFISSHPAFNDTIDSLKNEFKDDKSNSVIICGAHDFSRTQSIDLYKKKYDKVIVFNQEPLTAAQRQFMHKGYFAWLNYYKEQIKIELKKLGYNTVDWVDKDYWNKLINEMYNDEKDVEDAAEILRDYETEEQERMREEQELSDMFDGY